MMYYEEEFPVRYYETDQMGVVHHSNYIRFFELARNQMMAAVGFPIWVCERDYHVMIPEGEVLLGFIDSATFRPCRCPEPLATIIENHLGDR